MVEDEGEGVYVGVWVDVEESEGGSAVGDTDGVPEVEGVREEEGVGVGVRGMQDRRATSPSSALKLASLKGALNCAQR